MPRIEPAHVKAVSGARAPNPADEELYQSKRRGFLIGCFVAYGVWSVTPLAWLTVLLRTYRKGSPLDLPMGGFTKAWYIMSLCEIPFSIYLKYITLKASGQASPPKASFDNLLALLTKSLSAGLPPVPGNVDGGYKANGQAGPTKRSTRASSAKANGNANGHAKSDGSDLKGLAALEARPVDPEDAEERREKLRSWFHYAPMSEIYEDNVREWLAWAFAARELRDAQADPEINALLEEGLKMMKYRLQIDDMKPGYNKNAVAIRLTIDRVKAMQRPLGYYVVTNGFTEGVITYIRLRYGFHYEKAGSCWFLVKPPVKEATSNEKKSQPILFLHGLGIGLGQYIPMLKRLGKHKDGVVILVQPHISTAIHQEGFLDPPSKDLQAAATLEILARYNMTSVTTLSHSNGTMVLGWILRTKPDLFTRNILVDPVSFCLWEGSVCYAFIYQQWRTFIEVLLGYFVGREIGIAHTIGRRFIWFDMVLWADELPNQDKDHLHIVFGEKDILVDVRGSVNYLRDAGVPDECISIMQGYQHGQALMHHGDGMKTALGYAGVRP